MKLSEAKVNVKAINEGGWVPIPGEPGFKVKSRGIAYEPYRTALDRAITKASRGLKKGQQLTPAEREAIQAPLMIEHLTLDWSGLDGDDDKPVAYTKEFGLQYVLDPEFRTIYDYLAYAAAVVGQETAEEKEDAAKN